MRYISIFYQHFEDVQKGHFAVVSRKITFDYKHVANGKSLEKRLFRHPQKSNGCTTIFRLTGYGGSVISAKGVADYVGSFATACGKKTDYVGSSATACGKKTDYVGSSATACGKKTDYVGSSATACGKKPTMSAVLPQPVRRKPTMSVVLPQPVGIKPTMSAGCQRRREKCRARWN